MIIDLHGLIEAEAIPKIDLALMEFENSFHDELTIITGNGHVLKGLAEDMVSSSGFSFRREGNNGGAIIVYK